MVLVVEPDSAADLLRQLREAGERPLPIGTVQEGGYGVVYDFPPQGGAALPLDIEP